MSLFTAIYHLSSEPHITISCHLPYCLICHCSLLFITCPLNQISPLVVTCLMLLYHSSLLIVNCPAAGTCPDTLTNPFLFLFSCFRLQFTYLLVCIFCSTFSFPAPFPLFLFLLIVFCFSRLFLLFCFLEFFFRCPETYNKNLCTVYIRIISSNVQYSRAHSPS
jgi:hypothetical protein